MMPKTADQEVEVLDHDDQDVGFIAVRTEFRVMTWANGDINVMAEDWIELCMN